MGGKGRKRREKNYRAAHGGNSRLPPPPNPSSLDALPSKLRQIMFLAAADARRGAVSTSLDGADKNTGKRGSATDKKRHTAVVESEASQRKDEVNVLNSRAQDTNNLRDGAPTQIANENKKKKRKRAKVNDLRFEAIEEVGGSGSKRKERKKQRLEERKKKRKTGRADDDVNFPGREEIKFGEVVQAPPKLVTLPKPLKNMQDASQERLRLQAVENYRKRKGWASRPGVQLPPPVTSSSMS